MKRDNQHRTGKAWMVLAVTAALVLLVVSCKGDKGSKDYSAVLLLSAHHPPAELPVKGDGLYVSPDGKASLDVTGAVRVLKLSGTRSEMGYNYGYLLAAEIMNTLNRFSCWVAYDLHYDYDTLSSYQASVNWDGDTLAEMEGMLEGIQDALPEDGRLVRPARSSGHAVGLDDLKVLNTLADWACSSLLMAERMEVNTSGIITTLSRLT